LNLRGVLSQRLLPNKYGRRSIATEIMLNEGLVKQLIEENKTKEIRSIMEKNRDVGMQSFDQSLLDLFIRGEITEEQALAESDNAPGLRLQISQARGIRAAQGSTSSSGTRQHLTI
jgi:twitching motility protein PilU